MSRTKRGKGAKRSSAGEVFYRTAPAFLSVYCTGADAAPHTKWLIASLVPRAQDGAMIWVVDEVGYHDPQSGRVLPVAGTAAQFLVGNEWVDVRAGEAHSPGFRVRWHFRCGVATCRIQRNVSNPSSLYPSITEAVAAGFREIELTHLVHARGPEGEPA